LWLPTEERGTFQKKSRIPEKKRGKTNRGRGRERSEKAHSTVKLNVRKKKKRIKGGDTLPTSAK